MSIGNFYWSKEIDSEYGLEFIILGYMDEICPEKSLKAWIVPERGSNMCKFSSGENVLIDFDPELLYKMDYTGTPVLYPTPNRVRNGMFQYKGEIFNQVKNNEPVFAHGLVHNEKWNYSEPLVSSDCVKMDAWIDFNRESGLFEAFPFNHRLMLEFKLSIDGIRITYMIINNDVKDIPFGFALHPYFTKLSGEEGTFITLPASCVMDCTADLLPTGRLIDVGSTIYDLRKPAKIGSLDMDHVFTGIEERKFTEISYSTKGIDIELNSSEDFTHLVLYTPSGKSYFCIENQTCSTDAHNMYDRGFAVEAGLKFVPAGKSHTGYVKYIVKRWRQDAD